MEREIIILENFESNKRKNYWDKLESKYKNNFVFNQITTQDRIKHFIDSIEDIGKRYFVIFGHERNISTLGKQGKLITMCKSFRIPLVIYSGGSTQGHLLDKLILKKLYISTLYENADTFFNKIKNLKSLTSDDLGVLVDVDPDLEKILGKFAVANPFNYSPELIASKEQLQKEINKTIQKKK